MKNIGTKLIGAVTLALTCFSFCHLRSQAAISDWHTKQAANATLGAEVNDYYRVVGMPKSCICHFMSNQPAYSKEGHDLFYVSGHPKLLIEVEYSDDGQKQII